MVGCSGCGHCTYCQEDLEDVSRESDSVCNRCKPIAFAAAEFNVNFYDMLAIIILTDPVLTTVFLKHEKVICKLERNWKFMLFKFGFKDATLFQLARPFFLQERLNALAFTD